MMILNYLLQYHIFGDGALSSNEESVRNLISTYYIAYFFVVALGAPILEELVFRFGFDEIKNKYLYLFISSFAFALMHSFMDFTSLIRILTIMPYLAIGLSLGLIYLKTKNVLFVIIMHCAHNIISYIIITFL